MELQSKSSAGIKYSPSRTYSALQPCKITSIGMGVWGNDTQVGSISFFWQLLLNLNSAIFFGTLWETQNAV